MGDLGADPWLKPEHRPARRIVDERRRGPQRCLVQFEGRGHGAAPHAELDNAGKPKTSALPRPDGERVEPVVMQNTADQEAALV